MKKHTSLSGKQLLAACCILIAFTGLTLFLFGYRRDEKQFQRIASQLFEEEMKSSTLNMHYHLAQPDQFGIYDYEAVLPVYSAEERLAGQASTENMLASLERLDESKLSEQDAYTYKLLQRSLQNSLRMSYCTYYNEPLAPSSGMQSQFPILLAEYTFRTKRDVEDYLSLLDQTGEYFDSLLLYEQEKAAAGLLMPASSLEKVKKQCDTIVSKTELEAGTHFLQTTFEERLQRLLEQGIITEKEADACLAQNDRLLITVVQPAYEALADGLFVLEDVSVPMAGLGATPQGREYYKQLFISETGSYRPIEETTRLLTEKFREECAVIRAIATKYPDIAHRLSSSEFSAFPYQDAVSMLTDLQTRMKGDYPTLPTGSPAELHTESRTDFQTNHDTRLSPALPTVTVKNVSPSLEQYCAPAFYLTSPIDDTDNNVIYINQKNSPTGLELYTTLAHEGYPGHLYQTVYSNRTFLENQENKVRQLLWYGGYLEGWALYVEFDSYDYASRLMQEQGREQDAVCIQLEKHNRSLQLCLYSLLDIMIHYENASYHQIAKLLGSLGISDSDSVNAIYAYIVEEPCNYLKYYVGYLEILELQKVAKEHWGDTYSDYTFHKFYLDCGPSDFTSLQEQLLITIPPQPSCR